LIGLLLVVHQMTSPTAGLEVSRASRNCWLAISSPMTRTAWWTAGSSP